MLDPLVWIALIGLLGLGALDSWHRSERRRTRVTPTVQVHKVRVTQRRD